jgi:hypothetical protein
MESLIPQSGVARVSVSYRMANTIEVDQHMVRVIEGVYAGVIGLPEPAADCLYIVSHMVRMALPRRRDLLSPADEVRDENGNILACRMFEANIAIG